MDRKNMGRKDIRKIEKIERIKKQTSNYIMKERKKENKREAKKHIK